MEYIVTAIIIGLAWVGIAAIVGVNVGSLLRRRSEGEGHVTSLIIVVSDEDGVDEDAIDRLIAECGGRPPVDEEAA